MGLFWVWVIVGIIVGYLAKRVIHEGSRGILGDLVVGVIGALVGGGILNYFVHAGAGFNIGSILVGFVGAAVFLWGFRLLSGRSVQPETVAKLKFGAWALLGGAVIATIIGFAWGGWTTTSAAQNRSDAAGPAARAAVCFAPIIRPPEPATKHKTI